MDLGNKIKELRDSVNLTQEKMAKELGISRSAIAHYEINLRQVPLEVLVAYSKYFEASVDEILGLKEI